MSNYILQVNDATKKFSGLMANEGITFDVGVGEILGLVGPNGAGKTTLFNSLSGVHQLTRGTITFDGQDITKLSSHQICKLGIGRTFQIPQAIVTLSVEENVLIGALCKLEELYIVLLCLGGLALGFGAVFAIDKLLARSGGFGMEVVEVCPAQPEGAESAAETDAAGAENGTEAAAAGAEIGAETDAESAEEQAEEKTEVPAVSEEGGGAHTIRNEEETEHGKDL